jgi:hypothetical protein
MFFLVLFFFCLAAGMERGPLGNVFLGSALARESAFFLGGGRLKLPSSPPHKLKAQAASIRIVPEGKKSSPPLPPRLNPSPPPVAARTWAGSSCPV